MSDDDDPHERIALLEAQIEALAASLNRCRWLILLSQASMIGGALWMLAVALGAMQFTPAAMLCSIAAVIGGIVGFGSNTSTAKQTAAELKDAEAQRDALIGNIELRVVREGR